MLSLKRITDVLTSLHNWLLYEPPNKTHKFKVGEYLKHIHYGWIVKVHSLRTDPLGYYIEDVYDNPGDLMGSGLGFMHIYYEVYIPPTTKNRRCINLEYV